MLIFMLHFHARMAGQAAWLWTGLTGGCSRDAEGYLSLQRRPCNADPCLAESLGVWSGAGHGGQLWRLTFTETLNVINTSM